VHHLQCIQSATGENLTEDAQITDRWKWYCEDLYHGEEGIRTEREYWKSLRHFVQRLLVRSVRQQVAKPQVLMTSQQGCSNQEERQHWTECTEYVWGSGKLVSGQRNGRSPPSSHFPRKVTLNSVKLQYNCSGFPCKEDPSSDHTGKIRVKTETEIADEQAGFRQGRGLETRSRI